MAHHRPRTAPHALDAELGTLLAQILDKSPAAIRRGLYTLKQLATMPFLQSAPFAQSQIAPFRDKRRPLWSGR